VEKVCFGEGESGGGRELEEPCNQRDTEGTEAHRDDFQFNSVCLCALNASVVKTSHYREKYFCNPHTYKKTLPLYYKSDLCQGTLPLWEAETPPNT